MKGTKNTMQALLSKMKAWIGAFFSPDVYGDKADKMNWGRVLCWFVVGVGLFDLSPVQVANAQLVVITHESAEKELSFLELQLIYEGEITRYSPILIQLEHSKQFMERVLDKSERAFKKNWVKLLLSGNVKRGPMSFSDDEDVVAFVKRTPGAIGFISLENVVDGVNVVKLDGINPGEPAYPLNLK